MTDGSPFLQRINGYLTVTEVADVYDIPVRTVQNACSAGLIEAQKWGRQYAIPPEAAAQYARRHRRRG
jgi:excisionase family DNA binding protein